MIIKNFTLLLKVFRDEFLVSLNLIQLQVNLHLTHFSSVAHFHTP